MVWMSPKHESHGLPVWVPVVRNPQRSQIYKQLDDALNLLKANAPGRHERVRNSLNGFLVLGIDAIDASYDPGTGICQFRERFMLAPETTIDSVACCIVHEATHGWLSKLGIPYDEPIRHRVELVCIKASLLAAQRLPCAEAEVERCRRQLSVSPDWLSDDAFFDRAVDELRENGTPEWLTRIGLWIHRKRAAKVAKKRIGAP